MKLLGKFVHNQFIKIYRCVAFPFVKLHLMISKGVMFGIKGYADRATTFEGNNYIGQDAFVVASKLGRGTYIGDGSRICNLEAGKFCSIGFNVTTAIGKHPVRENISTSPSLFSIDSANNYSFTDVQLYDDSTGGVAIGNDVWIGNGALLMGGITIGDGAIIGAGSVVNKPVAPYEIWAGVPAKCIGKRFDDETIAKLIELKWWDKEDSWIRSHAKDFANPGSFFENI